MRGNRLRFRNYNSSSQINQKLRFILQLLKRRTSLHNLTNRNDIKIYYGCGNIRQPGYINIDIRWTPSVDILADLSWCSKHLKGKCQEVYLSHVLEHFGSPGRSMRNSGKTVIGALEDINKMLKKSGLIRLAVPDFKILAQLYSSGQLELFPRLLGRLVGEQDYKDNHHNCIFDRKLLESWLTRCGFFHIEEWEPDDSIFNRDGSFDMIEDVRTSLNLVAYKISD
jgi:predicted SAM-dependent methyltransferase